MKKKIKENLAKIPKIPGSKRKVPGEAENEGEDDNEGGDSSKPSGEDGKDREDEDGSRSKPKKGYLFLYH